MPGFLRKHYKTKRRGCLLRLSTEGLTAWSSVRWIQLQRRRAPFMFSHGSTQRLCQQKRRMVRCMSLMWMAKTWKSPNLWLPVLKVKTSKLKLAKPATQPLFGLKIWTIPLAKAITVNILCSMSRYSVAATASTSLYLKTWFRMLPGRLQRNSLSLYQACSRQQQLFMTKIAIPFSSSESATETPSGYVLSHS